MIRIDKICHIKELGVFHDFVWPQDLPQFQRYNLIYGWNGSGKTLLSRIFAGLQSGQAPKCEGLSLELSSGEEVCVKDFEDVSERLKVRVFNQDFVENVVYRTDGTLQPIYVFGEKATERQRELENIKGQIANKQDEIKSTELARKGIEQELDKLCTNGAREVRDTLRITGRRYEREQFRSDIEAILTRSVDGRSSTHCDEDEKTVLLKLVHSEPRRKLDPIDLSFSQFYELYHRVREFCTRTILATVIEDLKQQPDVNLWVEQGLRLHKDRDSTRCLFCGQPLPAERIEQLEGHFSKEYEALIDQIEDLVQLVRAAKDRITKLQLPDADLLYPDLREEFTVKRGEFARDKDKLVQELDALLTALENKRHNPFRVVESEVPVSGVDDGAISCLNNLIAEHNRKVDRHVEELERAGAKLKELIVAEWADEYQNLKIQLNKIQASLDDLHQQRTKLVERRCALERDLVDRLRPAEELNGELASYLGHSELQLEVEETGYRITRKGKPADSLSEGERTAIALLYFLKSLSDQDFDLQNGIVVIDDPVSSLDSTALYYAFGFMKSRVADAGQLFVLTHNFLFFKQVETWYRYLKKQGVQHYMLEVMRSDAGRNSRLAKLDPLLRDYESEYHYLFSLVFRACKAGDGGDGLVQYYYLPNVMRRLLEAFLAFKVPGAGSIHLGLQRINFDDAKKHRIERFCETHSHNRVIDDPEHDPLVLGEGPSIATVVMDLIRTADEEHFNGMLQLLDRHG